MGDLAVEYLEKFDVWWNAAALRVGRFPFVIGAVDSRLFPIRGGLLLIIGFLLPLLAICRLAIGLCYVLLWLLGFLVRNMSFNLTLVLRLCQRATTEARSNCAVVRRAFCALGLKRTHN